MKTIMKKGITVQDWVLISLVTSGMIALVIISIHSYSADSGIANNLTNPVIESHYNNLDQNIQQTSQMVNSMNQSGGLTLLTGFQAFMGGTVSVLNIALGSITVIPMMLAYISSDFGIPSEVTITLFTILTGMLGVVIIFAIINSAKAGGRV